LLSVLPLAVVHDLADGGPAVGAGFARGDFDEVEPCFERAVARVVEVDDAGLVVFFVDQSDRRDADLVVDA